MAVNLSPPVAKLIQALNLNDPTTSIPIDLTKLSALVYVSSTNSFYPTTTTRAIAAISGATRNTSAGVNPLLLATSSSPQEPLNSSVYTNLAQLVGLGSLPADHSIADAFYVAASTGWIYLLINQITVQNGAQTTPISPDSPIPGTVNPSIPSQNLTLRSLMALFKSKISSALPYDPTSGFANPNAGDVFVDRSTGRFMADIAQFFQAANAMVSSILAASLPSQDQRAYLFNEQTIESMVVFGLGPWLVLTYILQYSVSSDSTYIDQVFARYAAQQAVKNALTNLVNAYPDAIPFNASPQGQRLVLAQFVNGPLSTMTRTLQAGDIDGGIATISQGASQADAMSRALTAKNATLANRLAIAGDVEAAYEAQLKTLAAKKRAFYAWVAAYVLVVAVLSFLVVTDRLAAAIALSAGAILVILFALIGAWAWTRLARAGYVTP